MFLKCALLDEQEESTKRNIARLQRDRDCGVITDSEYEDRYETVMQDLRLRFAQVMDNTSWLAYNIYKNETT